jgi:hypothetical protein
MPMEKQEDFGTNKMGAKTGNTAISASKTGNSPPKT